MLTPLECIALRKIRYNDRHDILTAYTRQMGRVSMLVPASAGRSTSRTKALTQPLALFSCIADVKPSRTIFTIRDIAPLGTSPAHNPLKSTIALFIADILAALLRESQRDELLFSFISQGASTLYTLPTCALANFHICFLIRLQQFMGVAPDWSTFRPGRVLDFVDGIFRDSPPLHGRFLPAPESAYAATLARISYRNMHLFRLTHTDRSRILDFLIAYYNTHFPGLSSIASLEILRTLFS